MSTNALSQIPLARQERLVIEQLGDDTVVYDIAADTLHNLNSSASFVWQRCDGEHTVEEIIRDFENSQKTGHSEDIVWFALDQISQKGLLANKVTQPTHVASRSRRNLLRAASIGALVGLPLVKTLVAPTAASAQSGTTTVTSTTTSTTTTTTSTTTGTTGTTTPNGFAPQRR